MITDESLKRKSTPQQAAKTTAPFDNLNELLLTILKFTHRRQRILAANIRSADIPSFVPQDLPCEQFASILNIALDEHLCTDRLLFADTPNIKFLGAGRLEVNPVVDLCAADLLKTDKEKYIRFQVRKLVENALNQRFAAGLLRQRQPAPAGRN